MIWLHQHTQALRQALRRLWGSPLNALLAIVAMGIALALPTGGHWLIDHATRLARQVAPVPQLSIYLRMDADAARVEAITREIAVLPALTSSEFISRAATLKRYRQMEGLREVIEVLPRNPFPHAFVLTPRDSSPAALSVLADELRTWPGVEHVQLDAEWVRRLDAFLRVARTVVLALTVLLSIGLVAITFTITRMQVLTQRDEIEVSDLLGASASFIRRPFLYFGALLGVCGGLMAWSLVQAGVYWLSGPMAALAQMYGRTLPLVGLGGLESAALLAFSGVLGWLGTALSLRQHLPSR
jgi:cell division transport system permease protein